MWWKNIKMIIVIVIVIVVILGGIGIVLGVKYGGSSGGEKSTTVKPQRMIEMLLVNE